jgi:hypothetical protein
MAKTMIRRSLGRAFRFCFAIYRQARSLIPNALAAARQMPPTISYFMGRMTRPEWLYLEFVNTCNADCIFCAYRYDPRPKHILSQERIEKAIVDFRSSGGTNIGLSPHHGETFVDRDAVAKIKAISKHGFDWIHTYTNASLLHRFGMREILCSGLTNLRLSLPPLDETIYRKIYQNNNYQRVLSNTRELLIAFASTSEKTVKDISIEFRSDRSLEACQAMPDYIENIAPYLNDRVQVSSMSTFDNWSGAIKPEDLLPGIRLLDGDAAGPKRVPCGRIFMLQILTDGRIRQCGCRVDNFAKEDELVVGHIDNMTLAEAFHSTKAKKNVASFLTGKHLDVCRKCSWYSPQV